MSAWPASLPQFFLEAGYREPLEDQLIESDMDAGPAKVRRRFTTATRIISGSIAMTQAQAAVFETFFATTCAGGSLPFTWVHPRTRAPATFRFRKPLPTVQQVSGDMVVYALRLEMMP